MVWGRCMRGVFVSIAEGSGVDDLSRRNCGLMNAESPTNLPHTLL